MPLNNLDISKYRFTLQAKDKIILPAYKGSAFHGGFGHALKAISPTWFQYFYQPGQGKNGDWPKPFVMLPPLDEKESYQPREQFHCELTLFGEATQHYSICQAAMEYLGGVMGLGYGQGKYKVIRLDTAQIPNDINQQSPVINSTEIINARIATLGKHKLNLVFPTRLRLKTNNRLQKQTPEFQMLIARLLGRLKTLQQAYSDQETIFNDQAPLSALAQKIQIADNNLHWDDWNRFSGRQKKWMKFGGLVGNISYQGDLEPFLPYLALGEWVHIGGKTSFGLGKYILQNTGQ